LVHSLRGMGNAGQGIHRSHDGRNLLLLLVLKGCHNCIRRPMWVVMMTDLVEKLLLGGLLRYGLEDELLLMLLLLQQTDVGMLRQRERRDAAAARLRIEMRRNDLHRVLLLKREVGGMRGLRRML
jgi:hypothetical protein